MNDAEVVTLKEFITEKFSAAEKLHKEQLAAIAMALKLRSDAEDKYQEATRKGCEERHNTLYKRMEDVERWQANLEGKASQSSVIIAWIIAVAGLGIGLAALFRG